MGENGEMVGRVSFDPSPLDELELAACEDVIDSHRRLRDSVGRRAAWPCIGEARICEQASDFFGVRSAIEVAAKDKRRLDRIREHDARFRLLSPFLSLEAPMGRHEGDCHPFDPDIALDDASALSYRWQGSIPRGMKRPTADDGVAHAQERTQAPIVGVSGRAAKLLRQPVRLLGKRIFAKSAIDLLQKEDISP